MHFILQSRRHTIGRHQMGCGKGLKKLLFACENTVFEKSSTRLPKHNLIQDVTLRQNSHAPPPPSIYSNILVLHCNHCFISQAAFFPVIGCHAFRLDDWLTVHLGGWCGPVLFKDLSSVTGGLWFWLCIHSPLALTVLFLLIHIRP